jgi:hypothetical protein
VIDACAGEALVGAARALYADEISTGLDSNTTHTITKALRNYCHVAQVGDKYSCWGEGPEGSRVFEGESGGDRLRGNLLG